MKNRLLTLGTLRLVVDDAAAAGAVAQRRRLALLALLALAGERGMSREKVTAYLWPEQSASRARHLLSEALYVIRRALRDDAIVTAQDELRLNGDVVWCDAVAFRAALRNDPAAALDLYCGPFLDGFFLNDAAQFEEWAALERTRLSDELGRALADLAATSGDALQAAEYWGKLAYHDPLNGRVALSYMESLSKAGNRARALQYASSFTQRLRDELDIEPDADFAAFVSKLQQTESAPVRIAPSPASPHPLAFEGSRYGLEELEPEFEIIRSVGVGSVAEVFLAREVPLRRLVAIKVLLPEFSERDVARKRFEREAQTAARIEHPNVVTAFRFGRLSNGNPYIVMPYIDGGSLEDRLAATGPWSVEHAKKQLVQIASGLAAAHKLGIVHRDVRPGNIMYHRDSDRVLLTDFGLAAVLDTGDAAQQRLTRPGEQLGNIAYASPEQLAGESVSERADVYSFGVVAFEMVTGELPFVARTPTEAMLQQATQTARSVRDVNPGFDEPFSKLVDRSLARKPEQRPFVIEFATAMAG